ncbi:MAG: adenylate/guanylate cyclase domain-containing protein [Ignavibacteria bacterium]
MDAIAPVRLLALDHGPWLDVQRRMRRALEARGLERFAPPVTVILDELLGGAVKAMHQRVFRRVIEAELGLPADANAAQFDALYANEVADHGSQNLAHACAAAGWSVHLEFPPPAPAGTDALVRIRTPFPWKPAWQKMRRLAAVLQLHLEAKNDATGATLTLGRRADVKAPPPPRRLAAAATQASLARIFDELGYGIVHFSPAGDIVGASPSMLACLDLDGRENWAEELARAIPTSFHSDVLWGLALADGSGAFENFRIRARPSGNEDRSILFNVSGFRRRDGVVVSLWQEVSRAGGLAEGSIVSGMRIHNITRHYVPQLVEQKAREAVREGKDSITNEDRQVAVLFCDIVGFTSYVECNADNESIVETLNFILARVSRSVTRHRGAIDKFMGDSIMAIFDDPADAIQAGLDMQAHSEDLNRLRSRAGQQTLQLRIGVHWGEVAICNVGIPERLDWTAIGDVVNTAARIQKGCEPGAVLVSSETRDAAEAARPGLFRFGEPFGLQAKGKRKELAVCNVALTPA